MGKGGASHLYPSALSFVEHLVELDSVTLAFEANLPHME
jgi:hypothetical protein